MTPIVHITPKEQALQRENESLLQALRISSFTVETQAEQIDKLKAACDKFSESEMLLKAQPVQPVQSTSPDFIQRTNEDYAAWCKTFYIPEVLDGRGMRSLDGLHAWQERERRVMAQPVQEPIERTAWLIEFSQNQQPVWVKSIWLDDGFTNDANEAIHFPNKQCAKDVLDRLFSTPRNKTVFRAAREVYRVTEHIFYAAPVQPVQPALTDAELPELPRPDRNAWPNGFHDLFTAQQMRDYTQQATAPILAKLATQVALVEKCMVAMNENADRGEKAEAEVGRLVRKLALEREEFKAELDRIKAQPVQPAPLTDVCNHSNIIKADCIAWCGSCGVITWASDAIERVPGADAIARQKWCDENVVAWGCTNEASGRKCCKRWCQQRYCPVSLRADSGTGVQYD